MQFRVKSTSVKQTQKLGELLAGILNEGDNIFLSGDLGVGKSEFSRGFAKGLGLTCALPSPTFAILNTYPSSPPLYHFDWYRIYDIDELYEIGVEEFLFSDGICLVEWPSRAPYFVDIVPHLSIDIAYSDDDKHRTISIETKNNFREDSNLERVIHEYLSL